LVSRGLELTLAPVSVSTLIAETAAAAQPDAARARCPLGVEVETDVSGRYDRRRLSQLIHHLLDNAFKFGAGRPVQLKAHAEGQTLAIVVVDHGTGVTASAEERMFERYQRAVPAANYGGFGLGLWAARRIAKAHGGRIEHSATEGGGATFRVSLPLNCQAHEN